MRTTLDRGLYFEKIDVSSGPCDKRDQEWRRSSAFELDKRSNPSQPYKSIA